MQDYDPRPKMRDYFGKLEKNHLPSALHLVVWSRELLEFRNCAARFPLIKLYADWSLHTRHSQSRTGVEWLLSLNRILASTSTMGGLSEKVTQQLATSKLHAEFLRLLRDNSIPTKSISSRKQWPHVYAGMLDQIRGKPLTFPSDEPNWKPWLRDKVAEVRAEMPAGPPGIQGFWISRFFVEIAGKPSKTGYLAWNMVDESKRVVFHAPVVLSEYIRRPG